MTNYTRCTYAMCNGVPDVTLDPYRLQHLQNLGALAPRPYDGERVSMADLLKPLLDAEFLVVLSQSCDRTDLCVFCRKNGLSRADFQGRSRSFGLTQFKYCILKNLSFAALYSVPNNTMLVVAIK